MIKQYEKYYAYNMISNFIDSILERKQTRDIYFKLGLEQKEEKLNYVHHFPYYVPFNIYFDRYSNYERKEIKKYINSFIKINDLSNIIFSYVDMKYSLEINAKRYFNWLWIKVKYKNDKSENYLFRYDYTYKKTKKCALEYNETYDSECDVDACTYVVNKIIKKIKSDFDGSLQNDC